MTGRTGVLGRCPRISTPALAVAVFCAAVASTADAQQQAVTMSGRVTAVDNGVPLRRVHIAVSSEAGRVEPVLTDDEGRFVLTLTGPTPVAITATKAGYAAVRSDVTPEADGALRIQMPRGAAVSGRVVDSSGAIAAVAPVVALRLEAEMGRDPWQSSYFYTVTNDLGEYRIGGLPEGRYLVAAGGARAPVPVAPPAAVRTIESAIAPRGPVTSNPVAVLSIVSGLWDELHQRPTAVETSTRASVDLRPGDEARGVQIVIPAPTGTDDIRRFALERLREIAAEQGEPPPPDPACFGDGAIRGLATLTTGEPLAGVTVRLAGPGISTVITGSDGTYSFECVRSGDYTMEAGRHGHVLAGDLPPSIAVGKTGTVTGPVFVFHRAAAATGAVVDEHGEPMQGVTVRAVQIQYVNGRSTAVTGGAEARSDDRGQFRIFGLAPGEYLLAATLDASLPARSAGRTGYAPLYFPGTSSIESATPLRVEAGLELAGLNLVFRPTEAAHVSGVAIDAAGEPVDGAVVLVVSHRSGGIAVDPVVLPIGAGGAFTIPNVPPGDYVVHAIKRAGPGHVPEYASEYLTVGTGSPPPLSLRTSPGATLTGHLTIEGEGAAGIRSHEYTLMVHPSDPDLAPFLGRGTGLVISSTGGFYGIGLYGPRKVVLAKAPPDWYLESFSIDGIDVTDTGADLPTAGTIDGARIVISTRGATIAGRAVDEDGEPVAASIAVMPVDRTLWVLHSRHLKTARTRDGAFTIRGLPPGDYWIAAVDALDAGPGGDAWQRPSVLETLVAGAERVTLGEAETRTVVVRRR